MSRCSAIKASGDRCKAVAIRGSEWCPAHHPDRAEQRRRAASKGGKRGGRGRPGYSPEIAEIKALLKTLTDRVIGAEDTLPIPANHAAVAGQLINARLRAVEVERKIRETEDHEERLERLEQVAEQKGDRRWRA